MRAARLFFSNEITITIVFATSQASEVYAELRKKVLMKQERQCLEGQLCSLLRIGGDTMSTKVSSRTRFVESQ